MRITVLGATGRTGHQLVGQAVDARHGVVAVVRDPARLTVSGDRLRVVVADLFDPAAIAPAIAGSDVVACALGASSRAPTSVCSTGVRSVLDAMRGTDVRRLLVVSNSAHTPAAGDSPRRRLAIAVLGRVLRHPFADLRLMEQEILASTADWTIFHPPRLTDGPRTGRYRTAVHGHVPAGWRIARADLADAMLASVHDPAMLRAVVGVSY